MVQSETEKRPIVGSVQNGLQTLRVRGYTITILENTWP